MIDHMDFAPVDNKDLTCQTRKCTNKPSDMQFYITEWYFETGASSYDGVYYCEECVKKELNL